MLDLGGGDDGAQERVEVRNDTFSSDGPGNGPLFLAGYPQSSAASRRDVRRAKLAEVIADHIVPRLHNLHQEICNKPVAGAVPGANEIAEFGALAMGSDIGAASVYFDSLRAKGHSLDTLFVHLLEPTARYLGELWDQDRCDFIDVTLGVAHLQELLSVFGSRDDFPVRDSDHRALLLTTPGERHLFGVEMVARFMRGAGWEVTCAHALGPKEGTQLVATDWYGIVGLTLSVEAGLETTARLIEEIRAPRSIRTSASWSEAQCFSESPNA